MGARNTTNSLRPAGATKLFTFAEYGAGISAKCRPTFPSESAMRSKKSLGYVKWSEKNRDRTQLQLGQLPCRKEHEWELRWGEIGH